MGQVVGYVQEYTDSLLKFLLEAKRPAVYRARNINVMPPDGGDGVLEIRWKEPGLLPSAGVASESRPPALNGSAARRS